MPLKYSTDELKTKNRWDEIYRNEGYTLEIDENMPRILEFFKKHNVIRVLDLGCGWGRHLVYLAENGFDVYGIDISPEGIVRARKRLQDLNLSVALAEGSIQNALPYDSSFFDSVISIRVLHHGRIEAIRKAIKEIERVLGPQGFIFVTVRKRVLKRWRLPYREIAPRTYVPLEGMEKDVVHYLFTRELLRKEFRAFKIHDIWVDTKKYYCLLGQKK